MNRNDVIMWVGRILTIIFTIAVFTDMVSDQELSFAIRMTVLGIVATVFLTLFVWQVYIARKYDGCPVVPFSFRWVMAMWLGSLSLLVAWFVTISIFDGLYTDLRSAFVWYQAGVATTWFMARWLAVQTPHQAGIGETGANK